MADRQRIIENNRSLRNIKSELENLLERGIITDETFDNINNLLPAESPLSGNLPGSRTLPQKNPSSTSTSNQRSLPPKAALANLNISNESSPPAYSQSAAPALPARATPATPQLAKPILVKARALYRYEAADSRDVALEQNDIVDVYDYVNNEWWMGRNTRTNQEGIFPKTYVQAEQEVEKATSSLPPPMQVAQTGSLSGPPVAQTPYSANGSDAGSGNSKMKEQGSKFGKKLGNAAIFGAGATIGGKIVNGLF